MSRPDGGAAADPIVREGGAADVPALAALAAEVLPEAGDEASLRRSLSAPAARFWLAETPGSGAIGFLVGHRVPPELEVLWLGVAGGHRRAGVARALLAHAARAAARVTLEVRSGNEPALAFYRAEGFRERGRRAGYYRGEDAVLLVRG